MFKSNSGVSVTKENAMTISGVYAAVRVLTDAISILPINVIETKNGVSTKIVEHPLDKILNKEPNMLMTAHTLKSIVMPYLLLWGNAYCVIERKNARPVSILPVHPSLVEVQMLDGQLVYKIKTEDFGKDIILNQVNVLHFRGLGDNVMGKSVIDYAADNLGLGKAAESYGGKFFKNGGTPSGILSTDQTLNQDAIKNLRDSWNANYGNITQGQKTAILEAGLKYQQISIPPEQAQFLETRKFSINDIARWFKVPPHKIGDLERATFSNIEEMNLDFAKESVMPYAVNIEQECTRKLLTEKEKVNTKCKIDLDEILRGDIATRTQAYKEFIQNGIMSANEIRQKEDSNPYEGGDSYWMPLNLAPITNGTNQTTDEKD
jgi:HK97 family phage portal protein